MISFGGKNFFLNGMELHCYALNANAILYGLMHPAFAGQEDTFFLSIVPYKGLARTCLPATKSVLQAE